VFPPFPQSSFLVRGRGTVRRGSGVRRGGQHAARVAARGCGAGALFAQAGAVPVQIRGANGSCAVQTRGRWTRVPWKPGCTAACRSPLTRPLRVAGLGREGSGYRLIRGVLPWSPATCTESRCALARLTPWELPSTSPPSVSAEPAAGKQRCAWCRGLWPWPWHGEPWQVMATARCGRSGLGSCSPKVRTRSGSLLASASLSGNNTWLHRAGEPRSALKPSCSRRDALQRSALRRIPESFCLLDGRELGLLSRAGQSCSPRQGRALISFFARCGSFCDRLSFAAWP